MNKTWPESDKQFVITNADKTDKELHQYLMSLGKTYSFAAVRKQRQRLNIHKKGGRPKPNLI